MVPWSSVIFSLISTFLAFVVPIAAAIWICRRYKVRFNTVLIGALTFFVMQIVLRIPLLQVGARLIPFDLESTLGLWIYWGFLAITAALFEELGRFGAFKLFRLPGSWETAVGMGIGHGGIEAILLVGINAAANTVVLAALAMNTSIELPAELVQPLIETAPYMFLLGGVERILTMPIHVAFSLLVVAGAARKQFSYIGIAIAGHFLLNFPLGWLSTNLGIVAAEGYVLIASVAAWAFIIRSRILPRNTTS